MMKRHYRRRWWRIMMIFIDTPPFHFSELRRHCHYYGVILWLRLLFTILSWPRIFIVYFIVKVCFSVTKMIFREHADTIIYWWRRWCIISPWWITIVFFCRSSRRRLHHLCSVGFLYHLYWYEVCGVTRDRPSWWIFELDYIISFAVTGHISNEIAWRLIYFSSLLLHAKYRCYHCRHDDTPFILNLFSLWRDWWWCSFDRDIEALMPILFPSSTHDIFSRHYYHHDRDYVRLSTYQHIDEWYFLPCHEMLKRSWMAMP